MTETGYYLDLLFSPAAAPFPSLLVGLVQSALQGSSSLLCASDARSLLFTIIIASERASKRTSERGQARLSRTSVRQEEAITKAACKKSAHASQPTNQPGQVRRVALRAERAGVATPSSSSWS